MTPDRHGRERELQDALYDAPYHHLVHLSPEGRISRASALSWGIEYLCYLRHVVEIVLAQRPASVLDIGCGDGRLLREVTDRIDVRAVGVDASSRAIAWARAAAPAATFACGAVDDLAEPPFDVVTMVEVLEHVPDPQVPELLAAAARNVAAGGLLVVCVPADTVPVSAKHHRHYDRDSLLRSLEHGVGADLALESVDHVYAPPRIVDALQYLTVNRHWVVAVPILDSTLWRLVWRRWRTGDPRRARHIVATMRKG